MEASFTTILSVIIGGGITFLASYMLEARRLKNEKFKFTRDKIISVGEDFYRFSAYALLRFETLLDNYETIKGYDTQEAREVLKNIDINLIELLKKISENNLTITSADIFYNVSGATEASALIQSYKAAEARLEEKLVNGDSEENIENAIEEVKVILRNYIALIQRDRLIIKEKVTKLLSLKSTNFIN